MKKLVTLVGTTIAALYVANAYSYAFKVINETDGILSAYLDTIGGRNYTAEIQPGQTWEIKTGFFCIRGVSVQGKSGSVNGTQIYQKTLGNPCKGYDVTFRAFTHTIINETDGILSAYLDTIGGRNYTAEIQPGQTWEIKTGFFCIRGVSVQGKSGSINGTQMYRKAPSDFCKNYNVRVTAKTRNVENLEHGPKTIPMTFLDMHYSQ
jgi:hypothetical protein